MTIFQKCAICGKRKRETSGYFFRIEYLKSLGVQSLFDGDATLWLGRVFACDRCTKPLERANVKAKEDRFWADAATVKNQYLIDKQEKRKQDLDKVLSSLSGWVRIKDITEAYNKLGHYESARGMSVILRENGFTQIRRRTHGYAFVFVDIRK